MSKLGIIRLIIGSKKALTSGGWFTFKTLTFNSAFFATVPFPHRTLKTNVTSTTHRSTTPLHPLNFALNPHNSYALVTSPDLLYQALTLTLSHISTNKVIALNQALTS